MRQIRGAVARSNGLRRTSATDRHAIRDRPARSMRFAVPPRSPGRRPNRGPRPVGCVLWLGFGVDAVEESGGQKRVGDGGVVFDEHGEDSACGQGREQRTRIVVVEVDLQRAGAVDGVA